MFNMNLNLNIGNIFSPSGLSPMCGMGSMLPSGGGININDMLSLSGGLGETFGGNQFAGLLGGAGGCGMGGSMGMVPGFGGSCNPMGSMFGGMMQMMQQQQQMMMMMIMMMMMQMMQQQNQMTPGMGGGMPGMGGCPTGGGSGAAGSSAPVSSSGSAPVQNNPGSNGVGSDICNLAASRLGDPYSQAKRGQGRYTDCSYLTQWCYKQKGINIAGTAGEQLRQAEKNGWMISKDQLQPGDLVFWGGNSSRYKNCGHVGIYVGDGYCIEASSSKGQVVKRKLWGNPIGYARPQKQNITFLIYVKDRS